MSTTHPYSRIQARRSLFHTVGFRAISQAATVVSYIVLVRSLPENAFGVLNILYSFIPLVSVIGSLGLEQTLKRFQPEYLRADDAATASWLVRVVTAARLVANLTVIGLVLLTWGYVGSWLGVAEYRPDFAFFSVLLLLHFQSRILQLSLASHMLHSYSVGSVAVLSVVKFLVYSLLASTEDLTLRTAILADTFGYGLSYLYLCIAHRRCRRPSAATPQQRPPPEERKRLLRYAAYNNFNDAGGILLYPQIDNFFLALLMNPLAVGAYAFYVRLYQMARQVIPIFLFENVVQPLFFATPQEQASERIPRYFTLLINLNLIVQLPLVVYTGVYHEELVQVVFGGKFMETADLLPLIVTLGTASTVFAIPVTLIAQYQEKARLILLSQLFGLYQLVAMLLFIPIFGVYGAAFATGTFHLLRNAFVWWRVRDQARWLNCRAVITMTLLIWGSAFGVCYGLKLILSAPAIADLLCGVAVCATAALFYVRSPALAQSDRAILSGLFHGREGRILRWMKVLPASGGPSA